MIEPKPRERRECRNCGLEIEWVSERSEEGWPYDWHHLPAFSQRIGPRRCAIYAEPA